MVRVISVVVNSDTRHGYKDEHTKVGKLSHMPLNGTRSIDFLSEGVKSKMNFFRGHQTQCILYIDEHEEVSEELRLELTDMVRSYGNESKIVCRPHDRSRRRWYDYITIEALKLADGDYVVHFDSDSNAFRSDDSDIIEKHFDWLDGGYKYICSPVPPQHKEQYYWATTQFFMCKKETLNLVEVEKCFDNGYLLKNYGRMSNNPSPCCLEHTIGLMVKEGEVFYPPRDVDSYIIFCWWEYVAGILKKLNNMSYTEVRDYIKTCGLTQSGW
jgi:hypothetical protein